MNEVLPAPIFRVRVEGDPCPAPGHLAHAGIQSIARFKRPTFTIARLRARGPKEDSGRVAPALPIGISLAGPEPEPFELAQG